MPKYRVKFDVVYDGWVVINPAGDVIAIYGFWEFAFESAFGHATHDKDYNEAT